MKFPAWYGILVGFLMIAQWIFSIMAGSVPEFQTSPWEIAFHLAAEMSTALILIIGGIATMKLVVWGKQILLERNFCKGYRLRPLLSIAGRINLCLSVMQNGRLKTFRRRNCAKAASPGIFTGLVPILEELANS